MADLYLGAHDFGLDVARGLVPNVSGVNKFGRSTNVDSGVLTDIWDRANPTDTQQTYLAPTAARVHAIVSSSTDDDGAPVGLGARTLVIYGLQTWDSAESNETVTLNGTTPVNTANSYVMIHRMIVLTWGASGPNVGKITATAATDGTVTAQITAGQGQTQMAIYGVPSTQDLYMTHFSASLLRAAGAGAGVDVQLVCNDQVDTLTTVFVVKHTDALLQTGSSKLHHRFNPPKKFPGPCLVKLQATGTSNDLDVSGGFDGYVITK